MADNAAAAEAPKRRTFRKFTYRGVDLEQLLDMGTEEMAELLPARARRRIGRGLKPKSLALIKKLRDAKKNAEEGAQYIHLPFLSFIISTQSKTKQSCMREGCAMNYMSFFTHILAETRLVYLELSGSPPLSMF